MLNIDADAVLAEFARHPTPKGPRGGRRLDGAVHDTDTDAAMKWMEARIDALAVEVAAAPSAAAPSARRAGPPSSRPRPAPAAGGGDIAALAQLETSMRQVTTALHAAQAQAAKLREALARAGIDAGAIGRVSPPAASAPSAAPPAVVPVRSRRSSGGGTSANDLSEATARRAGVLRRQLPVAKAQLESATRECEQLDEMLRASGLSADALRDDNDGGGEEEASQRSHPHPTALLHQLRILDRAARAAASSTASTAAPRAVHGLSTSAPPLIPLTVFADGFMLYRGPFRPFGERAADVFAQQVMAGMVPNELQDRHPDGLGFELHDKCDTTHAAALAAATSQAAAARAPGGAARVTSLGDMPRGADALLAPTNPEQLLQRLPSNVLRDGNMLPVRDEIAELLGRRANKGAAAAPVDADAVRAARLRRFGGN